MKDRNACGLMLMLLLWAAGSGLAHTPQPTAGPAEAAGVNAGAAAAPWFIETVDATLGVGQHVAIAIDPASGATYLSYYDATDKDLRMAKHVGSGGNCGEHYAWSCETVKSTGDVGEYSSIAIDPNTHLPAIAYYNATGQALELARALAGGGWDVVAVDGWYYADSGRYASLEIDSAGAAHIAYYLYAPPIDSLRYAKHVGGGAGNCGGNNYQCDTIDSGDRMGQYASLALDDSGQPRIAYYDEANGDLWYAQPGTPGNCGPENTWGCYQVSFASDAGQYASLDIDSSNIPHLAYYDATNGKLMYAAYVGLDGNCGYLGSWQCDEIDSMGTDAHTRDVSLALDGAGRPIIAYHKYIIGTSYSIVTFNVARPAAALGLQAGNCGPQNLWQCERIRDPGHSGDYSAIAVSASGLATVAYYNSEYSGMLRVAYQRFAVLLPLVMR